jgi:hypothetical protein
MHQQIRPTPAASLLGFDYAHSHGRSLHTWSIHPQSSRTQCLPATRRATDQQDGEDEAGYQLAHFSQHSVP